MTAGKTAAPLCAGLPPLAAADAKILLLGSMPGRRSLEAGEYYAHPRNAFWPIVCELLNAPAGADYDRRKKLLRRRRIAVWDVLKHCRRAGSLDSAIDLKTAAANDFNAFFAAHPKIKAVFFNGAGAEKLFAQKVAKTLAAPPPVCHRLLSTSPAHAAKNFQQKKESWRQILDFL